MNKDNKDTEYKQSGKNDNKKFKKSNITYVVLLLILTNIITVFVTNFVSVRLPDGKVIVSRKTFDNILQFEKLYTIKDKIDKYYIGEVNNEALVDGAAKGMAAAVNDPYTSYMDKKQFTEFTTSTGGSYVGLGIQVGVKDNKIIVVSTFENSPAEKAGVKPKDVIEVVNNVPVSGKDLEKATTMMKGKAGEDVKLTINRDSEKLNFDITRQEIELVTVKGEMLQDGIGYIQVSMFDEHTAKNFSDTIDKLKSEGMKSLIVDLRENPGGLLDQTVKMSSEFIPKGKTIVYTEDKNGTRKDYDSIGGDNIGLPVTIISDGNSASASEIFIGALKDYNSATVIGEKTFGKGVVQTTFYRDKDGFGDGTALKVTISKYFTPNGKNIHGVGIEPDIIIEYPNELKQKPYNRANDPQFNKAVEVAKEKLNK